MARLWKQSQPAERKKFEEMALKDKERFEKERKGIPAGPKDKDLGKKRKSTTKDESKFQF